MRNFALALALIAAPLSASAHEFGGTKDGVTVLHPWARATPSGAKVGAVFFEVKAAASRGDRLVGGKTKAAQRVEIHGHTMDNGVAKMRPVKGLEIPAGRSVVLQPNGYHLMLMGLSSPLKEGDTLDVTLVFERSGEVKLEATVEPIGAMGPHGFDHQPGAEQSRAPDSHRH